MSPQTQASSRQVDGPLLKVTDLRTAFRTDRGLVKSVDGLTFVLDGPSGVEVVPGVAAADALAALVAMSASGL